MSGYLSFSSTGNPKIDAILQALESAGDAYHNTVQWDEPAGEVGGPSYIDLIQQAANAAAKGANTLCNWCDGMGAGDELDEHCGKCGGTGRVEISAPELVAKWRASSEGWAGTGTEYGKSAAITFADCADELEAALTASPQAASDGDWYTTDDTGTHHVDWDGDPKRQLSILLKKDGSVGFAAYAYGQRFHGDAMSEDFWRAITALASPQVQGGEAVACDTCEGNGRVRGEIRCEDDDGSQDCADCNGTGSVGTATPQRAPGVDRTTLERWRTEIDHEPSRVQAEITAALASGPSGECQHRWQPDADVEGAVYCPKCDVTRSARAAAQDQGEGNGHQ